MNVSDLLVLVDAAYAATCVKNVNSLGCKYSREQIWDAINRVSSTIGGRKVEVEKIEAPEVVERESDG